MAYPIQSPMVMGPTQDVYAQRAAQMQGGSPAYGISSLTMAPGSGGGFIDNLQQIQQQLQAAYSQAQQIGNMQQQAGSMQQQASSAMGAGRGGGFPSMFGGIGSIGVSPPFGGGTNGGGFADMAPQRPTPLPSQGISPRPMPSSQAPPLSEFLYSDIGTALRGVR